MRFVFAHELDKFTREDFADALHLDSSATDNCLFRLLKRHAIATGAIDESEDSTSMNYNDYHFKWVGLILYRHITLVVCPKYFPPFEKNFVDSSELSDDDFQTLMTQMRRVLRVIRKADSKQRMSPVAQWDPTATSTDPLTPIMRLFDLYAEYGEYSNFEKILEKNGLGAVSWEHTVEQCSPLLTNAGPMYFELRTVTTARNSGDYITRLHRYLLTQCSRHFHESPLGDLLSLPNIDLSEESIDDFGDLAYIEYRLERELSSQFITWKRTAISLMLQIVTDEDEASNYSEGTCLGTDNYAYIWETMCKAVFDDKLHSAINSLDLGRRLDSDQDNEALTLKDIIPYPQWHRDAGNADGNEKPASNAKSTLIPDVVSTPTSNCSNKRYFCIYDAKYYTPVWHGNLSNITGAPGVESITKQFLYQSAYKKFVSNHEFTQVLNMFLVPTANSGEVPIHVGRVDFPGVFRHMPYPFSNSIDMWALPADWLARLYLDGQLIETATLDSMANISMLYDHKGSVVECLSEILTALGNPANNFTDFERVFLSIRNSATGNHWHSEPGTFELHSSTLLKLSMNPAPMESHYTSTQIAVITGSAVALWNSGDYAAAIHQFKKLFLEISVEFS